MRTIPLSLRGSVALFNYSDVAWGSPIETMIGGFGYLLRSWVTRARAVGSLVGSINESPFQNLLEIGCCNSLLNSNLESVLMLYTGF